ncbi:MAG TPA: hypothetical protein VGY57_03840 [Vicinamibacterales bacterium]|jgi:hypothetical protein|nr:hypothetical protein [Vicinamibacterales bacterium]
MSMPSMAEIQPIVIGLLEGLASTTGVVLAIFIGFCVIVGFTKTKRTAGQAKVVKSIEERMRHRVEEYLPPTAPHGPADQLRAPELLEAAARK